MNAFGKHARHVIVSGVPGALGARARIDKGIEYEIAQAPPPLTGRPSVKRYETIAAFMRCFDLVLTYNWGAIDGAMARRTFSKGMPPLVHHEDGFGEDEAGGLKRERNIYRRLALPAAGALVVPSLMLREIALGTWRQPPGRVHLIVNGIATGLYAQKPKLKAIPGFVPDADEVVIGALAGLRQVKDLPALVRACGGLSTRFRLVIVGEGPERETIRQAAAAMGILDRLVMPGFLDRPYQFIGHFDLLALSSLSEQSPISVIEAMAAGLPIAATRVGDIATMVSDENQPFIAIGPGEVRLRDVIETLASDTALRARIGIANRAKAVRDYDETLMIARYKALYERVMGRSGALG